MENSIEFATRNAAPVRVVKGHPVTPLVALSFTPSTTGKVAKPYNLKQFGMFIASSILLAASAGCAAVQSSQQTANQPPATTSGQITFSFGVEETVFNHSTDSCEPQDLPDTPAHAVRLADGSLMLADGNAPRNYAMFGADFSTLRRSCTAPTLVSDDLTNPDSYDNQEWILSLYRDSNLVHALIHNEYHDPIAPDCKPGDSSPANPCWYNSITYGVSSDGGHTFTHAAPPAHLVAPPPEVWNPQGPPPPYGYFTPSNIVRAQDGFYYSVFVAQAINGREQTCVMRTQTLGDATSWRAWDGTGFSLIMSDPYTGPPASLCAGVVAPAIAQPTLTYNTYLLKYMMVGGAVVGNPPVCGAAYALSSDLIHWTSVQIMRTAYFPSNPACQPPSGSSASVYFSIIDHSDTSVNFENSGQTPFLYYTRFNDLSLNRDLVRVPLVITSH
jgi:hypothetical protein